jgi:hypothetical protein
LRPTFAHAHRPGAWRATRGCAARDKHDSPRITHRATLSCAAAVDAITIDHAAGTIHARAGRRAGSNAAVARCDPARRPPVPLAASPQPLAASPHPLAASPHPLAARCSRRPLADADADADAAAFARAK